MAARPALALCGGCFGMSRRLRLQTGQTARKARRDQDPALADWGVQCQVTTL